MKLLKSSFWLHSIFYTLLQRFSLFFFGAVAYMVLVRGFSKEDNAVWALYLTILTLFETIKQGLLRNPTIKFLSMPEYAGKKAAVQSSALVINIGFSILAIGLVAGGGQLIARWLQSPDLLPLLAWSFLFIILLVPFNHFEVLLQSKYSFPQIFWAYFVRQGLFFTGILSLFFFLPQHFNLMNLLLLQIGSLLAGTLILLWAVRPLLLRRFHYDSGIIVHMFHFGKYIFGTNLFANLARSFDHFVTANTLDPLEGKKYVSNYNVVSRINNMMDMPSLAAADVLFPKNVETLEQHGMEKVRYYFEKMAGTLLAIILPMALFILLFPKLIIYILAGTEYYDAIPILQISMLVSFVRPLSYQYGSTLDAIGKPVVNFWTNALMMVIALGATWAGLVHFGGIGAVYATAATSLINAGIMYIILRRQIGLQAANIARYTIGTYSQALGLIRKLLNR
ncbi:MAG: oligosaccharide flippase family protein [Candidatus Pseudobacter hemicellulosilyticus]|uniref:Oligosaccharide flippase family protein n=1 Tax=Candidatus Pseudobacter hemicellulosilyticus TaxID=3121375 RepID=A0AAJ6BF56_9BACT|nr:MAG: oligosaccharide flippase family protein [Pseudobacter sp.]